MVTKRDIVFLSVVLVLVFRGFSHAELLYYTDEKGMIRITDDITAVPENQRPVAKQAQTTNGSAGNEEAAVPEQVSENAADARQLRTAASPADNGAAVTMTGPASGGPAGSAGTSTLPREFQKEFKDIIAASSIPPEGATASCAEFKEGLKKDMDKVFQSIRELGEAKKKGTLGFTDKLKGIWMLKSFAWIIYRHETGTEQCVKEFDKENAERWKAETKEIEALTSELQDK